MHHVHLSSQAQRTRGPNPRQRPQPNRIAGIAGAIAINAALLMLMLAPLKTPEPRPLPEPNPQFEWIEPRAELPPIPPPIVPATPARPSATVDPAPQRPVVASVARTPASVDLPPRASDTLATADTAPDALPGPVDAPATGALLEYLQAPPPVYPRDMLAAGIEGRLVLEVLVGTDGRPLKVTVRESSGQRALDEAARRQVLRRWVFKPAMDAGQPVRAIGLVPIAFSLGR